MLLLSVNFLLLSHFIELFIGNELLSEFFDLFTYSEIGDDCIFNLSIRIQS